MINKKQKVMAIALMCCATWPMLAAGETLSQAVAQTLKTNPDILAAVNERRARNEELSQARAGYNPNADLTAGYGHERSKNDTTRAQGRDNVHYNRKETALNIRQMLFDGFTTRSEVQRQTARINSAAHQIHATSENTALRAAEVYLDVLRRETLLGMAKDNLAAHEETYERIQKRSESGVGRRSDLDQVNGRRALATSNVIADETNLVDAETNYLRVVGTLPQSELQSPVIPADALPANLEEAVELALANHPVAQVAQADVEATKAQHEASKGALYPRFDFEMEGSWHDNLDGQKGLNQDALAMVRMRYNLINGGKDLARRAQTAHLINEAKEVRNRAHREIVESMRLSWSAYEANKKQLEYLRQHMESSKVTREAYGKQFNIGRRTLLDLLDSENEYFQAARAFTNAQNDMNLAQFRILAAMGKLVETLGVSLPAEADPAIKKDSGHIYPVSP